MNLFCNNKNTIRICLFLIFLLGGSGIGLFAQSSISGKIIDGETGKNLNGANVFIKNTGGFVFQKIADKNGDFKINLEEGEYVVTVSYIGYPSFEIEEVIILPEQQTKLNIELELTNFCGGGVVYRYKIPLFKSDLTTTGETIITQKVVQTGLENSVSRSIQENCLRVAGISWQQ